MRGILFRAKRIDNGEWIYGSLVTDDANHAYIAQIIVGELVTFEVIPETVGQWTGLTDNNGKKIFEGDIVKFVRKAIIAWQGSLGGFVLFFHPNEKDSSNLHWMLFDIGICPYEVIGNIHENSVDDI